MQSQAEQISEPQANISQAERLQLLKAAAYDIHRQVNILTQHQLPQIEREIAEIEQHQRKEN